VRLHYREQHPEVPALSALRAAGPDTIRATVMRPERAVALPATTTTSDLSRANSARTRVGAQVR
jgi:hypothetical protein